MSEKMSMQELIDWMPGYEWIEPDIESEPDRVRAITLWQPWASLIAVGLKQYETRGWETDYRGKLLIHAAKRRIDDEYVWEEAHKLTGKIPLPVSQLPLGKIVAIADLTACLPITDNVALFSMKTVNIHYQTSCEILCGNWNVGRFAWKLENIRPVSPLSVQGKQGLWFPDDEIIKQLKEN